MAKRKVGLFYFIMLVISIVFLVIVFNIDTVEVITENVDETLNEEIILDENQSNVDVDPIDTAINESLENQTDDGLAYAKGCWCPGAIADYWSNDCSCNVQQVAPINEKTI
jgi:hypothetical protein